MYKVTREVLTSTSERRSGFDTADDEFETDDDRGLRARSSNSYRIGSRSKDFRSTDEDADIDDWQDSDTFAKFQGASNTLNSIVVSGQRSRSATLDDSRNKCTCCPYGYHVDLDFLKHLNADEYENVMSDPRYLLKHHKRLHQMQQQQFQQQRTSSASATSANIGSVSAASSSQFHQQQPHQQQTSQKTYQHQTHQQQHKYHLQQQQNQQSTLRSKSPHTMTTLHASKDERSYDDAVDVYNKSTAAGTNTLSSTTRTTLGRDRLRTNGYYPTSYATDGYDPEGVRRQENVFTAEDGSTTTKVIEEVHKTRTTIINFDSEEDETDDPQKRQGVRRPKPASSPEPTSPGYEKEVTSYEEKLLPRQQHLIELQKKLQQIQPIDQRGSLKTYVNAVDPKPVNEEEQEDPQRVFRPNKPTYQPRPEEEEDSKKVPLSRSHPDPDPNWLKEKSELLKKINELEQHNLKEKREKDDYDRRIRELENENRRNADDYKNCLSQMKTKDKITKDVGIGDQKVDDEMYTTTKHFQVVGTAQLPVRIHEKELNTEETTEIREKEIKTIFVSGIDDKFSLATANQPSVQKPRTETKSIGVGDGNVFDDAQSRLEVHEKELRTVFIGGPEQGKVATRNVGILCKAAMRDVGMVHSTEDEKPLVKNASVGVGEMGVSESDTTFNFREGDERALVVNQNASMKGAGDEGEESYFASSGFCHTTLTNIKAGGLAGLKGENLKAYLEEVLKRKVHSVGTQSQFSTENKGTDAGRVGYDIASVGVSDDTIDVDVRPITLMKSVAIDHRPSLFHRCTGTELMFKLDVGTNTKPQETLATATNTDPKKVFPAATMTDPARKQNAQTGTELPIFFALDQYRTTGVMTDDVDMYNKRVNTESEEETRQRIGTTMTSSLVESSTSETSEAREIRRGEEQATGYRRYVEETISPGYLMSHTRTTRTHREGSSPSRPTSSGRTDSRADSRTGYTTTKVIQTRDKSPRRVTFEAGGIPSDSATSLLLGVDRVSKTTKTTGIDGVSQFVTETTGPGYTEKVVRESYSTTGKTVGIPLVPGIAGFPKEFFTEDGMSSTVSGSSTYISTNQTSSPVVPERVSKTRTVSGASSTLTKTEIDEKTGMKRFIKETKGPGYSETTVKSSYTNVGGDGTTFGLEFTADPSGKVPSQSVKGPYYTEKTVTTSGGDLRGAATIDLEFVGGKDASSVIHTSQDSKHFVTEVQCPGHATTQILVNEPIPIQIDESGVSVSGSTSDHVIKSTEKRTYSSSSSAIEGSVKGQTGIKTVIRESYGPNHVKTVTTEKIDMKTGKVISSSTTQSHYDALPKFEESSSAVKSSTTSSAKTSFDFARSALTSERFVPDQELGNVCSNYSIWIKDKSKFTQTKLAEMESVIFNRWFHAAGGETSNVHLVRSFIAYLNDLSPILLKRVINSTDENGNTVLHFALSHSRMDIVEVILDTNLIEVNHANKVGNTPILISALAVEPTANNLEVLRKLFSLGDVNAKTQGSSQTALMLATGRGRVEVVELLLSKCCQCDVNVRDSEGFTALICAAQKGHTDIVKLLLANGKCDVYIKNNDGNTALDVAKQVGHEFIVSQLESHIKDLQNK